MRPRLPNPLGTEIISRNLAGTFHGVFLMQPAVTTKQKSQPPPRDFQQKTICCLVGVCWGIERPGTNPIFMANSSLYQCFLTSWASPLCCLWRLTPQKHYFQRKIHIPLSFVTLWTSPLCVLNKDVFSSTNPYTMGFCSLVNLNTLLLGAFGIQKLRTLKYNFIYHPISHPCGPQHSAAWGL